MHIHRISAGTALALLLSLPFSAFAQDSKDLPATFIERYPAEQPSTQTPSPPPSQPANIYKQQSVTPPIRAARAHRPRSRIVVVSRSYLDAGTEVLPGERKFLDYAYPPTYQPYNVVTNIGGRVGWHNSPLPGPFFPSTN
jgi:hypothetical protein